MSENLLSEIEEGISELNGFSIIIAFKPESFREEGFNFILSIHNGKNCDQLLVGQWRSYIIIMNGDDYPTHFRPGSQIRQQFCGLFSNWHAYNQNSSFKCDINFPYYVILYCISGKKLHNILVSLPCSTQSNIHNNKLNQHDRHNYRCMAQKLNRYFRISCAYSKI